ncbi:MAG: AAA family ATPase, partial [Oribacterium sp.]|nr:AAA family ATPase [Oribacterium sp.]
MEERKLPVGIQSFEKIIENHNLYVDKTEYIYKLVHTGMPYFLSRPRRFGKSLLLSTMKAYWEGKKELFRGLAIERLEQDDPEAWQTYPVLYFDFNGNDYQGKGSLENALNAQLMSWEEQYHTLTDTNLSLGDRFKRVLRAASEQTGKRC